MDINELLASASTASNPWYLILIAFVAGILVSFTPCVYPMIPITAGILQSQAHRSLAYNLLSAFMYISGIALVYATLGYISATTSILFGSWLTNPWLIGFVILFFLYLAGTMFDLYHIHLPASISQRAMVQTHGSLLKCLVFGVLAGTVASPCLTPPLALLLGIAAKQGNPAIGFFTLFSFSLGMGLLLLLVGTFSSTLTLLPRSGVWMDLIKSIFGFMIFAACLHFLQPFFPETYLMIGYTVVAGASTLFYLAKAKQSSLALILGIIALLLTLTVGGYTVKMFV